MNIAKTITAFLLAAGLSFGFATMPAAAQETKTVIKKKTVHHRHRVGVKHIGRGTKTKTTVKTTTEK